MKGGRVRRADRGGFARSARRTLRCSIAFPIALALGACAGSPAQRLDAEAAGLGLKRELVQGAGLRHLVYRNRAAAAGSGPLHVYLDGDGIPWGGPGWPAPDPTPRNPLALRLMGQDPAPALYLGRPCYGGLSTEAPCHPWHWTHGRYSEPVVASLAAALESVAGRRDLVLIGYSGGGTLALLLAERVQRVRMLVTLAANLDLAAWTALHDYSPLEGSLDPARRPPLPIGVRQWHLAGADDNNVPPDLIRRALVAQPGSRVEVLEGVGHLEGWEERWPGLLRRIGTPP